MRLFVALIAATSAFAFGEGAITGIVVDQVGTPVGNAIVRLTPTGSGETKYRGESSINGKFKIEGVASGDYMLRTRARGFGEGAVRITVRDGIADLGTVKLPVIDCDAPLVICDYFYGPGSPPPQRDPEIFRGRVTLRFESDHPDFKLTSKDSGAIYLNPIGGTTIGLCDEEPIVEPIRIDGLGPGNDWCAITHDKHRAHVFITGGIVEPGVKEVPLWIVIRK